MFARTESWSLAPLIGCVGLLSFLACAPTSDEISDDNALVGEAASEPGDVTAENLSQHDEEMAEMAQTAPTSSEAVPAPEPVLLTVPAGTLVVVEFQESLSSHTSQVGQEFRTRITQAVAAQGGIAIPAGSTLLGEVTEAEPAQKVGGRARLSLDFHSLYLPSGQTYPVTAVFSDKGKSQTGKDAAIIGGATLGGAILGNAVDPGEGTKIGAIVGGVAGAIAAKKTKGKPVEVPAGTVMTLELSQPVTIEVTP
jgi:hypothetical protein